MHRFRENRPEFKGFSEAFARDIAPKLNEREGDRQELVSKARRNGMVLAGLAGLVMALLAWVLRSGDLIFGAVAAPFAVYLTVYAYTLRELSQATKHTLVGAVFDYIGWSFTPDLEAANVDLWAEAGLLPLDYDKESYEDWISGDAHGAGVDCIELHLERNPRMWLNEKSPKTLFRGQLIRLVFDCPLGLGRTLVLRDKGFLNKTAIHGLKRVGLVDPVFESIFEAYSSDQVEARVILDPAFMQRLVDLETSVSGDNIRFAFEENRMLIAVETRNLFEAGSMDMPLDAPERAQRILDEVGAIFDIVDGLLAKTTQTSSA